MTNNTPLVPALELAKRSHYRFAGESAEYRQARTSLLAEEIELRRHIERVAELRRTLPPGPEVTKSYYFDSEHGPVTLGDLFGDKQTLVVYTYMYCPQRDEPCPMCTSLLSAWDGNVPDIEQRIAFAIVARSPIERLVAFKKKRGWRHLKLYSDTSGEFSRDYYAITPEGGDDAGYHVFTRRDGKIRLFWSGEMDGQTSDPGQDPRGAPDLMPIWSIFDTTPEGRAPDWYPSLEYPQSKAVR